MSKILEVRKSEDGSPKTERGTPTRTHGKGRGPIQRKLTTRKTKSCLIMLKGREGCGTLRRAKSDKGYIGKANLTKEARNKKRRFLAEIT